MVIGFDGSRAFTKNRTGTENYSFQLLKSLAKIDKKNQYIIYVRPDSVILSGTKDLKSDSSQASLINNSSDSSLVAQNDDKDWPNNFQFKVINWQRLWTQGGLSLQTFKDNLDVLFVPAHTLPIVKRPGLKTVVTVHDLGSEYLPKMHQAKQRLYLGFMQKHQLKTATKIIAVSKATKEDLVKRIGIDLDKVRVVYEGFDKELYKPVKNDLLINTLIHYNLQPTTYILSQTKDKVLRASSKISHTVSGASPYYLFVGTVQPRKNLERLIKALSVIARRESSTDAAIFPDHGRSSRRFAPQDDNILLVIVGNKGWMSKEIYELPKKLGIEEKVKFLGYVPENDLPALYSGAAMFTFPSLFEGFGLPILEAQACGCPVLTSNTSSMPEVGGSGALFVDPYSVDDIVKGMERVKREGERVKLIKAGFENIKKFSWEKCAKETLAILESV